MNSKVAFLCVGAQKCGTTTLRAYLREHPQLDVPKDELHYFDNDLCDWDSSLALPSYHNRFRSLTAHPAVAEGSVKPMGSRLIAGEVTPIYMYWLPCLHRIHHYNPKMKIIFLLRNPMARAYSHWSMEYLRGNENLSFADAIRMEEPRLDKALFRQHRVYSYIDRGFYYRQLMRFFDVFPADNIRVLSAERFYRAPESVLRQISQFLGVSDFETVYQHHQRKGSYEHPLCSQDWHYIYSRLADDISLLASRVSWDISSWSIPLVDIN